MNAQIATLVYAIGIAGLFLLDRERDIRPSKALWIPVVWLLINESRSVSDWLNSGPTISQSASYLEGSPLDAVIFARANGWRRARPHLQTKTDRSDPSRELADPFVFHLLRAEFHVVRLSFSSR